MQDKSEQTTTSGDLLVLQFNEIKQPVFKEIKSKEWVLFGEKDNYITENYLHWFNNSAKHNAIITSKVTYIFGNGLNIQAQSDVAKNWINKVNSDFESLNDVINKAAFDNELYGGFYLHIIPLRGNGCEIYHLSYHKVRSNADNTVFYYKEDGDFKKNLDKIKIIPAYELNSKNEGIYFYKSYRPGLGTYPLPGYIGAANYILSDIEVGKATYNNASNGFAASKFINFYNGEPDDKQKRAIENSFTQKFTGASGKKILVGFNNDPTKRPTIDDLGSSDLTKEDFTAVDNLIQQNIYAGHQIVSPMLFGIKTEGQLGGATELEASYEIFKNTYANKKQQELERVIKIFAEVNDVTDVITFQPLSPVNITPAEDQSEQMTNNAVRNLTGRQHQQLMRIIRQVATGKLSQQQATTLLKSSLGLNDNEISSLLEFDTDEKGKAEDVIIGIFSEYGTLKDEYISLHDRKIRFDVDEDISGVDYKILSLIQKDKRITAVTISDTLKISVDYVTEKLKELQDTGLIVRNLKENTIELTKPLSDLKPSEKTFPDISIKYSYDWSPKIPYNERDTANHPSRPFCKKLVSLNRYYSRSEIETISQRLGYSVWDRRGGWWNKGDGTISPSCRHIWRSHTVIKKK